MKRLLLILMMALLLTGCAGRQEQIPENPSEATEETVSLYIPNSSVEQQSGGAVKVYVPEKQTISAWPPWRTKWYWLPTCLS